MKIKKILKRILRKLLLNNFFNVSKLIDNDSIYGMDVSERGIFYKENREVGSKNFSVKTDRVKNEGPFEWPNIVVLNKTVANFINSEKKVVNIGAGTGIFEWHASKNNPSTQFVASELDEECVGWCRKNRKRENIIYCSKTIKELLKMYNKFEIAVCIEVLEHVKDYGVFLKEFSELSDKAIITTPNKDRSYESSVSVSPSYQNHVREWDAGEFYWILKIFYSNVILYSMPNAFKPEIQKVGLLTRMTPIIAVCRK